MIQPNQKRLLAALCSAVALGLAGCGGSDDDDDTPAPPGPTAQLDGVVLDGALKGATVCLDVNENRACDGDEPSTTSGDGGAFSLTADAALLPAHTVLAVATAGTTVDADGGPVARGFTLAAPAGRATVVSPFTTLVQSELDGGRAGNLVQAEQDVTDRLVGTAGDTGGLTVYSDYLPRTGDDPLADRRARMAGLAQLLVRGFVDTAAASGKDGTEGFAALGLVATGSLQQLASQVTGPLAAADGDALYAAVRPGLVPSAETLAGVAAAKAKTAAEPIEGAWTGSRTLPTGETVKELYVFFGDGTYMHRVIETSAPATDTAFDNGFGHRYGRYTFAAGTLTTTVLEAAEAAGPQAGSLPGVTVAGDQLTGPGLDLVRVGGADGLAGAWVRPDGSAEPEVLVMFADGSYVHSTFYSQHDPYTGTAGAFETAKLVGMRKGSYTRDAGNAAVVNFGDAPVQFTGALAVPSTPGVGALQADGSLSMTGLRMVRLGTPAGAKAVSGLNEATRSRIWSGRFFSRTVRVANANRTQYVYVRGPSQVLSFLQAPAGSDATLACDSSAANGLTLPFGSVDPSDGLLKQFVIGTGTAASAGYARRRLNVGQPTAYETWTPVARPSDNTARCAVPM